MILLGAARLLIVTAAVAINRHRDRQNVPGRGHLKFKEGVEALLYTAPERSIRYPSLQHAFIGSATVTSRTDC
jgi:hypothetical protein